MVKVSAFTDERKRAAGEFDGPSCFKGIQNRVLYVVSGKTQFAA
jgi:hypothetical protein